MVDVSPRRPMTPTFIRCDDPACDWKIDITYKTGPEIAVFDDARIGHWIREHKPGAPVGDPRLSVLQRHRATFIEYARQRIENEDWHGLSDVANDLRALDVEIRMTKAAGK